MSERLRLLHISDLHLDGESGHGEGHHRLALFSAAMAEARRRAHIVIAAGDFFDSHRVTDELVHLTVDICRRAEVPVVFLPGNHDALGPSSPFERESFTTGLPGNVHVLRDLRGETHSFRRLDLEIWGRPHVAHQDFRPLEGAPDRSVPGFRWRIGIAHGHLTGGGGDDRYRSWQISPEEIEAANFHYLALGHWDRQHKLPGRRAPAAYSGSLAWKPPTGGPCGQAMLVTVTPQGTVLEGIAIRSNSGTSTEGANQ